MAAANEIRNIQELTLGDFIDFDVLHEGVWKRAQWARTVIQMMGTSAQSDREAFDANLNQIAQVARRLAATTPTGDKIKVSSYDM
jgi:hypothetical protein